MATPRRDSCAAPPPQHAQACHVHKPAAGEFYQISWHAQAEHNSLTQSKRHSGSCRSWRSLVPCCILQSAVLSSRAACYVTAHLFCRSPCSLQALLTTCVVLPVYDNMSPMQWCAAAVSNCILHVPDAAGDGMCSCRLENVQMATAAHSVTTRLN